MHSAHGGIDWFQVITDITRKGYPTKIVALTILVPKSTLLGWKQGAEPKHADGERLLAFWCRVMERDRAQLPTTDQQPWWSAYHVKGRESDRA